MASTNKTTNYELSQFVETDRPAWLTDYNGDMRTIDSTMKAISDVASGASGSISALADRMSTAEGNISTNANDIDTLEARADSLEAQAQSTTGTIANIQTEQTAQNLGIEAATELGYNLARPYDSASTYAVGDYVLFQNTLYKCVTAVPVGEVFVPAKWLAIKVMDEIGGGETTYITNALTINAPSQGGTVTNLSSPKFHKIKDLNILELNFRWVDGAQHIAPSTYKEINFPVSINSAIPINSNTSYSGVCSGAGNYYANSTGYEILVAKVTLTTSLNNENINVTFNTTSNNLISSATGGSIDITAHIIWNKS